MPLLWHPTWSLHPPLAAWYHVPCCYVTNGGLTFLSQCLFFFHLHHNVTQPLAGLCDGAMVPAKLLQRAATVCLLLTFPMVFILFTQSPGSRSDVLPPNRLEMTGMRADLREESSMTPMAMPKLKVSKIERLEAHATVQESDKATEQDHIVPTGGAKPGPAEEHSEEMKSFRGTPDVQTPDEGTLRAQTPDEGTLRAQTPDEGTPRAQTPTPDEGTLRAASIAGDPLSPSQQVHDNRASLGDPGHPEGDSGGRADHEDREDMGPKPQGTEGEAQEGHEGNNKYDMCRTRDVSAEFLAKYDRPITAANLSGLAITLPFNTSFGYQPERNIPRWRVISDEIVKDGHAAAARISLIDYGSNAGWFSLCFAATFPRGMVVSVDIMSCRKPDILGNRGGMQAMAPRLHKLKGGQYGITNNILCDSKITGWSFGELRRSGTVFDYQLSLSVLHWLHMKGQRAFFTAFANHVSVARTSFVEMPLPAEGVRQTDVRQWYAGMNNDPMQLMGAAVAARMPGRNVTIRELRGGYRPMYRVDVHDVPPPQMHCDAVVKALLCRHGSCHNFQTPVMAGSVQSS